MSSTLRRSSAVLLVAAVAAGSVGVNAQAPELVTDMPRLSLGYNGGAAWESLAGRPARDASIVYSLALGLSLTDRVGTFLEIFGDRQVTGATATSASVDGGLTLLLDDLVQLDVAVGRGLRGPADDLFIGMGLSFRVPR